MDSSYIITICLVLAGCIACSQAESYWERRTLECKYSNSTVRGRHFKQLPDCVLYLRQEWDTPLDPKCFEEIDPRNRTRTRYTCPLQCPNSSTDSVTLKVPAWIHKCYNHGTYGTDKVRTRGGGDDRHMWKVSPCLEQDIELSIWCKFQGIGRNG